MKIKLHYSLAFVLLLCFFTRLFIEFSIFMIIIIFHEIGHILMALLFKQKVSQITITALGGVVDINFARLFVFKEFLINIAGIFINFILLILFKYLIIFPYSELIINYNILLIVFNLLPIYPLDGYRLINNITRMFFRPYRQFKVVIFISWIFLGLYLYYSVIRFSLAFLIVGIFLIQKNIFILVNKDYFVLQHLMRKV